MKKLLIFLLSFQMGCASKTLPTQALLTSDCPAKSECSVQLFVQKSLEITTGNHTKYELKDNPNTNVVVYKLRKIAKTNVQDADSREEIVFEYHTKTNSLQLTDGQLQSAKMLFGRFCYCPGETGYFQVNKGRLLIDGQKATLEFSVTQVPQITRKIAFLLQ